MTNYILVKCNSEYEYFSSFNFTRISGAYCVSFSQRKMFNIDLAFQYNWASSNYYHLTTSQNAKIISNDTTLILEKQIQNPLLIADVFTYENVTINPLYFFLFKGTFDNFDSLSFSYKQYTNHSLVNSLYDNNTIRRRAFGIRATSEHEGILYLGGFPHSVIDEFKHAHTCNVISSEHTWGCSLTQVKVGKVRFNNVESSYFQTNDKRILVPKRFMTFMKENYFNAYIKNKTCVLRDILKHHFYECVYNQTRYFPMISFYFDNVEIPINNEHLYRVVTLSNGNVVKQYYIEENYDNENQWIFAIAFLKSNPMLFDYDNSTITFYYNSTTPNNDTYRIIQCITIIHIVCLCLGVIYLVLHKFSIK